MFFQRQNSKKKLYVIMLVAMAILSLIFLNSFFWPYEGIGERKILAWLIAGFGVVIVPIFIVKNKSFYNCAEKTLQYAESNFVKAIQNKKKLMLSACVIVAGVVFVAAITYVVSRFVFRTPFNLRLFYTGMAIASLVLLFVFLWKSEARKIENIFIIVALIMGIFCITVTPNRVGIAPDDEIHYARTLEISNCLNNVMYNADAKNIGDYAKNIYAHTGFDRVTDQNFETELNELYETRQIHFHEFTNYDIWSVTYVPSAIGIVLGRGLDLDYTGVFNMGRFFNLLMYVTLVYFAIKRIKSGKVLIAAIGLIPGNIFLASNYSYDPWITGFTILGFSYFFTELQTDEPLKYKNIIIMVASIAIGSIPKAIYFALLFPLLFMPKKKFQNSKQRKYYYVLILGAAILLMATFLMPMFIEGPGTGDSRGGGDVNSTEQVQFILNNPIKYTKILVKFLLGDYITLGNVSKTMQSFAYVGDGFFGGIICIILLFLGVFDRGENKNDYLLIKGATLLGNAATIVLATTALYISFTAVASDSVAGMQGRYLIPVLYPTFYTLGIGEIKHKIRKKAIECLPIFIIASTFIFNMGWLCALYY